MRIIRFMTTREAGKYQKYDTVAAETGARFTAIPREDKCR